MASGSSTSRWIRILLTVLLALAVFFGIKALTGQSSSSSAKLTLSVEHQKMREKPEGWLKAEKDVSTLVADARGNKITAVGVTPSAVLVSTKAGEHYYVSDRFALVSQLLLATYKDGKDAGFPIVMLNFPQQTGADSTLEVVKNLVGIFFPFIIIGGLVYFMRFSDKGGFELAETSEIRFADVIGATEAKAALSDLAGYLKDPSVYTQLGARPPAGILMVGGPGTGKTRLAQALAGECGVPFIAASGSDFTSKFYGAGVQKVKSLFEKARKNAPCIVFIDEIDGIAARSSTGNGPGEAEANRIINQVLVEMDGFKKGDGVIVIGATNLPHLLDPALLREGRFDRRVHVRLPDVGERAEIFKMYAAKIVTEPNIDYQALARLTTGLSPAAIESIVNNAATLAARKGKKEVSAEHLADAIEINRMGEVNGSQKALTPHERERIAVHEAGHAVIAQLLKSGRVEKVTILPRGGALGVTLVTQDEDKQLHLQSELEARIQMLLAGRNAELLYYNEASSGAAHDLEEASKLALAMVARFGFGSSGSLFSIGALGDSVQAQPEMSHAIQEAKQLLDRLNTQCQANLRAIKTALDEVTKRLLAEETVAGTVVEQAVAVAKATEAGA